MNRSAADEMATECLGHRMRMINRAVLGVYEDFLRRHDLSVGQFSLLVAVCHAKRITPKELGRYLRLERYEVTKDAASLKKAGLVAEQPATDGRTYHLVPNPAGEALLEEIRPGWRTAQARVKAILTEDGERLVRDVAERMWPEMAREAEAG